MAKVNYETQKTPSFNKKIKKINFSKRGGRSTIHDTTTSTTQTNEQILINTIKTIIGESDIRRFVLFNATSGTTLNDNSSNDIDATLSTNATNLDASTSGDAKTLTFGAGEYFYFDDADDMSFTSGGFTIIVHANLSTVASTLNLFSKFDTFSGNQREYLFRVLAQVLRLDIYDNATGGSISAIYNRSLSGDVGSFNTYACTYNGNGSHTGIKLYRNGKEVQNAYSGSGAFNAMANTTAQAGNFQKANFVGIDNIGRYTGACLLVIKGALEECKIQQVHSYLNEFTS